MKSKWTISEDKLIIKEVWLGGESKDELLKNFKINNIGINELGLQIFNHKDFIPLPTREKFQSVEISVVNLGFLDGAITKEVYQKAEDFGLKLCPTELGPYMRLQYIDRNQPIDPPKGNWQNIAMKKLSDEPDFPNAFYLRRREDGFWLRGYRASPEYIWDPADRFIFVRM